MRELADSQRIRRFAAALGREADAEGACYLTGGTTAVLVGWRDSTLDVDMDELRVNVELASPADFIPVPAGWQDRSIFAVREGRLTFYHFDPYAQALAKLERGHRVDLEDVRAFVERGLVDPGRALAFYDQIEPELYRFPAIDPRAFRRRVEDALG